MWISHRFYLACFAISAFAYAAAAQSGTADQIRPHASARIIQTTSTASAHTVRIRVEVDGSLTPERVPDDVAYFHFFWTLAKRKSADQASNEPIMEERRRRAYLQYFFNRNCGPDTKNRPLSLVDIDRILAVADDVSQRIAALDSATLGGRDASSKAGSAVQGESVIQRQRLKIAVAGADSLNTAVGPDVAARIRAHVTGHMKRRMKLVVASMSVPNQ